MAKTRRKFLRAEIPTEVPNWGCENEALFGLLHTEINGQIIKEKYPTVKGDYGYYYQNMYKTLRENMPLRERPEHGFNTIRIVELAMESNDKKATVNCNGLLDIPYPAD